MCCIKLILTRSPKVAMYLFERYPGQDQYCSEIRLGLKPGMGPSWVQANEHGFLVVVAKQLPGTTTDEKELNKEPGGKAGDRTLYPRMLYVRAVTESQQSWSFEGHKVYTRNLVLLLNNEVAAAYEANKPKSVTEKYKYRSYYVDEVTSWDSIPEERMPVSFYMQDNKLRYEIMLWLFEERDLNERWAVKYACEVDHFFHRGGSEICNKLGIPPSYEYSHPNESVQNMLGYGVAKGGNYNNSESTTDGEEVGGSGKELTYKGNTADEQQPTNYSHVVVVTPSRNNKKQRTSDGSQFVLDEAEEDPTC
jgi:hypothetical protein